VSLGGGQATSTSTSTIVTTTMTTMTTTMTMTMQPTGQCEKDLEYWKPTIDRLNKLIDLLIKWIPGSTDPNAADWARLALEIFGVLALGGVGIERGKGDREGGEVVQKSVGLILVKHWLSYLTYLSCQMY